MKDEELQTSKAYQALNQEEPISSPPELDAAILAQAHKAVQAKPQALDKTARSHLTLRWGAPIASAALVVLSVTVFILMPELEQQHALESYKQDFEAAGVSPELLLDDIAMQSEPVMSAPVLAKQERVKASAEKRIKKAKVIQPAAPRLGSFSIQQDSLQSASGAASADFDAMASKPIREMEEKLIESIEEVALLSPEQWSKVILDLIEKGDWLNADNQYLAFAKHYPEHDFNKEYAKLKQRHAAGSE